MHIEHGTVAGDNIITAAIPTDFSLDFAFFAEFLRVIRVIV